MIAGDQLVFSSQPCDGVPPAASCGPVELTVWLVGLPAGRAAAEESLWDFLINEAGFCSERRGCRGQRQPLTVNLLFRFNRAVSGVMVSGQFLRSPAGWFCHGHCSYPY